VPDRQREPHRRRSARAVPQGPTGHLRLRIEAEPAGADADAELAAIEAGAQDFEAAEEGATLFYTDPTDLDAVCKALPDFGFAVQSANLGYKAKNPVSLSGAELEEVEAFLEALDNHDDVQNVYVGLQAN
jgi:transcriptional/translational regulatory protein YebC/TACO1